MHGQHKKKKPHKTGKVFQRLLFGFILFAVVFFLIRNTFLGSDNVALDFPPLIARSVAVEAIPAVPFTPSSSPEPTSAPEPITSGSNEQKPKVSSATQGSLAALQNSLDAFWGGKALAQSDKWAVYVLDVASGDYAFSYSDSDDSPTIAASIIKLFIAGAVYHEADINASFTVGSAILSNLENMLRDSDNNAANALVTALGGGDFRLGAEKVNAFAKSLDCNDTTLGRKFLAPTTDGENYTTVSDCAQALRLVAQGSFVSETASGQMYSWLKAAPAWNENKNSKIRAGVAAVDPTAVVANKTGENAPPGAPCIIENDIAIITTGDRQYILCVMSNSGNSSVAKEMIRQLAGLVHQFFLEQE
jgi:beta-lactamase class A